MFKIKIPPLIAPVAPSREGVPMALDTCVGLGGVVSNVMGLGFEAVENGRLWQQACNLTRAVCGVCSPSPLFRQQELRLVL